MSYIPLISLLFSLFFPENPEKSKRENPPNIILIFADDLA